MRRERVIRVKRRWAGLVLLSGLVMSTGARTGHTWHIETVDSPRDVGYHNSLALDPSGSPHISYRDVENWDLKYAAWNPSTSNWEIQTVDCTGDVGNPTSLALDSHGDPHISYGDWTNMDLKYAVWNPATSAWDIEIVDSAEEVGAFISLALDSSDKAHISYWDMTNRDLKYAYVPEPRGFWCWGWG